MVELDLHLKLEKYIFATSEVEYLGMIVKPGQLAMDPVKLNRIAHWPTPSKVKDVRSFLGFANFSSPFAIATNAFKCVSGTILLQTNSNGEWHPCSYLFQSFSPAEQNYNIYDHELLAVIRALKAWRHYLHGSSFPIQVFTDHKNLTYFRKPQALNHHQARWLLDLADFDLTMIHVPGSQLAGPDALSRCPDLLPSITPENKGVTLLPPSLFINLIDTSLSHHIQSSSTSDPLVLQVL